MMTQINPRRMLAVALLTAPFALQAQQPTPPKPADTEVWAPEPRVVTPGATNSDAPSDAIVLFAGKNLDEWVSNATGQPAAWTVEDGGIFTVNKRAGDIKTKRAFKNFQLHVEWRIPLGITGTSQSRGNSGVFLGHLGNMGYELQVLDSYENKTYVNGQAGSVYKQSPPLVNAARKPGEWQTFEVIWTAPTFKPDGSLATPAHETVFYNGVLVQNDFVLKGVTKNAGVPEYKAHGALPILLQAHGDPSAPVSFRNMWLRELQ